MLAIEHSFQRPYSATHFILKRSFRVDLANLDWGQARVRKAFACVCSRCGKARSPVFKGNTDRKLFPALVAIAAKDSTLLSMQIA